MLRFPFYYFFNSKKLAFECDFWIHHTAASVDTTYVYSTYTFTSFLLKSYWVRETCYWIREKYGIVYPECCTGLPRQMEASDKYVLLSLP